MQVDRIFVASAVRLTQTKLSLAATLVIIALSITSTPVFADTLVAGAVYFDSEQTLKEVINLSEQHDNEGIAELIKTGHISDQTEEAKDVVVLTSRWIDTRKSSRIPLFERANNLLDCDKKYHQFRQAYTDTHSPANTHT